MSQSISTGSASHTLNVVRYTRADDRWRGLLLTVGRRIGEIGAAGDERPQRIDVLHRTCI